MPIGCWSVAEVDRVPLRSNRRAQAGDWAAATVHRPGRGNEPLADRLEASASQMSALIASEKGSPVAATRIRSNVRGRHAAMVYYPEQLPVWH